eukprot:TRINITY_DN4703_c0_g1_i10.p1 TRINITY_DN4703_c0_g1~~TRINITY_DN4703_c0_g1_i10.p1  ORF type:complete len:168 (-),score=0.71 TRINITY_DN4703_c0_g1_i10:224-727(-)
MLKPWKKSSKLGFLCPFLAVFFNSDSDFPTANFALSISFAFQCLLASSNSLCYLSCILSLFPNMFFCFSIIASAFVSISRREARSSRTSLWPFECVFLVLKVLDPLLLDEALSVSTAECKIRLEVEHSAEWSAESGKNTPLLLRMGSYLCQLFMMSSSFAYISCSRS